MKKFFLLFLLTCTISKSFAGKYEDVVKSYYTAIDAGNFEQALTLLSPDLKAQLPFSQEPYDLKGFLELIRGLKTGFPDMQHTVVESVEAKGSVAFKGWLKATNTGMLLGRSATGNTVSMPYQGYFKINRDGKISSIDITYDVAAFQAQLMKGIPAPKNKATELTDVFLNTVINAHQPNALKGILSDDFQSDFPSPGTTRDQFMMAIQQFLAAFPDVHAVISGQHAEGNKVMNTGYWEGTHKGSFMEIAATGKKVRVQFMDVWYEKDGKLFRNEVVMDLAGLHAQLGDPVKQQEARNIGAVKTIYHGFQNGDMQAIMQGIADDVVWTDAGTGVGKLQADTRYGKKAVMDFFVELDRLIAVKDFRVDNYIAEGNTVVSNGFYLGYTRSGNKLVATDFAMIWEFNDAGKLIRHHSYLDTDNVAKALAGNNNLLTAAKLGYKQFMTGDINGILSAVADNVVWIHSGDASKMPFAGTFHGKEGVLDFFKKITSSVETIRFEPTNFVQKGNTVTNDIHGLGKALNTGEKFEINTKVKWTFNDKGQIVRWEAIADTKSAEAAFTKS